MDISEVRILLAKKCEAPVSAYCRIVIGGKFAIYNLRIIEKEEKRFVAMPQRELTAACRDCGYKNSIHAHFCNWCGSLLGDKFHCSNPNDFYRDVFHPVDSLSRKEIEEAVFSAYLKQKDFLSGNRAD